MKTIVINDKKIHIESFENERFIAIKPICKALGIDYDSQIENINSDEILKDCIFLSKAKGVDGKKYNSRVMAVKYIYGWLFTINVDSLKHYKRVAVTNRKKEIYDAIFDLENEKHNVTTLKNT